MTSKLQAKVSKLRQCETHVMAERESSSQLPKSLSSCRAGSVAYSSTRHLLIGPVSKFMELLTPKIQRVNIHHHRPNSRNLLPHLGQADKPRPHHGHGDKLESV